jgi:4-hydroxy-tetrahydrodipicolinate reductase
VTAALEAGRPVVVGTTGWYARRGEVEALAERLNGAVLIAPNFSVGVAAFAEILRTAARALKSAPGFDAHMVELHHTAKKDAPSGTAANLEKLAAVEWGREIPITSIRTGSVPGTHEMIFDGPYEQIRLEHVARDRRVFADGALLAAKWLIGKRGVFTMQDVISMK